MVSVPPVLCKTTASKYVPWNRWNVFKKKRGYYDFQYKEKNKTIVVRWNNNSMVTHSSKFRNIHPVKKGFLLFKNAEERSFCPTTFAYWTIHHQNGRIWCMRQFSSKLQNKNSWEELWWPISTNYVDLTLTNAWKISKLCPENEKSLSDFRREVALSFLQTPFESEK